jgi:hypothetical protein
MDIHIEPGQPLDLTLILPAAIFRQKFHALQRVIAPIADTPEAIEIRDHSIMAQLACLAPATADEITLATQYITATAGADRCFAQANQHADDFDLVMKASARGDSLMRKAIATRRLLDRIQTAREKRDADPIAAAKVAWTEHAAIRLMADALGRTPPAPMAAPPPRTDEEPIDPNLRMTKAEEYALAYPYRAAEIRAHRGLPPNCDFDPPAPDLLRQIVASTSPVLRDLDEPIAAPG